jgi:CheY-like chemotaxis protein
MARISIVSDDVQVLMTALGSLNASHEVRTAGARELISGTALDGTPDILVVDRGLLISLPSAVFQRGADESRELAWLDAGAEDSAPASRTPAPPRIIALLSPGEEEEILSCFEGGVSDYLLKPVNGELLQAKVDALMAQRSGLLKTATIQVPADPISISDDGRILHNETEQDDIVAQLGHYEVRGVLGRGGYGVVYRAFDMSAGREVALKVLPKTLNDSAEAVARFFRESTAISRLNHPNIVQFFEVGSFQERLYFTMELVEGKTLKAIADEEGPLDPKRAAKYVAGIAKALTAINSLGLVHRDVKPENVLITENEQVKLIDFGLVRIQGTAAITSDDDVLGTPYFMCPEYIREPGIPDIRYDLYALGVTFFNLLTGEYPFDGKNAAHVMEKHLRCPAPPVRAFRAGVPVVAERIVKRLLCKDPANRPQSPSELLEMMEPLLKERRGFPWRASA